MTEKESREYPFLTLDERKALAGITGRAATAAELDAQYAIDWLAEAARYFTNRPTNGEDSAHWSNVANAERASQIGALIAALRRERDEALRDSRALERTHQAIPLEFCLDPPDGGDVKPWEAAERMAKALSDARAANAQMAQALRDLLADIDERAAAYRHSPSENIRRHYANVPLSDGVLSRARDALPPLGEDAIMREALMRSVKVVGKIDRAPASPSPEPEPFGADVGRERLDAVKHEDRIERLDRVFYIRWTSGPDYEDAFICVEDGEPDMNDVARVPFGRATLFKAGYLVSTKLLRDAVIEECVKELERALGQDCNRKEMIAIIRALAAKGGDHDR
jgi:hypothetical protein